METTNWTCVCGKKANCQDDTKDWRFFDDFEPEYWKQFDPNVISVTLDAYCPQCYLVYRDNIHINNETGEAWIEN